MISLGYYLRSSRRCDEPRHRPGARGCSDRSGIASRPWPAGSPEADAEGWPRPDEAVAYPEVTLVAIVFGAASVLFGIIPQPLFDLTAHAGRALGGLFLRRPARSCRRCWLRPRWRMSQAEQQRHLQHRPMMDPVLPQTVLPPSVAVDRRRRSRWRPGKRSSNGTSSRSAYSTHARCRCRHSAASLSVANGTHGLCDGVPVRPLVVIRHVCLGDVHEQEDGSFGVAEHRLRESQLPALANRSRSCRRNSSKSAVRGAPPSPVLRRCKHHGGVRRLASVCSVGWRRVFNPETETGSALTADFDEFFYTSGTGSLRRQLGFRGDGAQRRRKTRLPVHEHRRDTRAVSLRGGGLGPVA